MPASLDYSVGALVLAARHADNCEAIAKLLVAKLSSRMAMGGMGGTGGVRVPRCRRLRGRGATSRRWPRRAARRSSRGSPDASTRAVLLRRRGRAALLLDVCADNPPPQAIVSKSEEGITSSRSSPRR